MFQPIPRVPLHATAASAIASVHQLQGRCIRSTRALGAQLARVGGAPAAPERFIEAHRDGEAVQSELRELVLRVEERAPRIKLGADDYICKPFSPREVVARVKAVLRRVKRSDPAPENALTLNESGYKALLGGKDLGLTAVEFELLKVLASHPGHIYTRDQLIDTMYRDQRVVSDRTVDSHVKKIRKKISSVLPDREIVHSVYGVGYKYEW